MARRVGVVAFTEQDVRKREVAVMQNDADEL